MNLRTRSVVTLLVALLALGSGAWLRYHAFDLAWSNDFVANATVRTSRELALIEIARVLLWSGAALLALSGGAWLFVPALRLAASEHPGTDALPTRAAA